MGYNIFNDDNLPKGMNINFESLESPEKEGTEPMEFIDSRDYNIPKMVREKLEELPFKVRIKECKLEEGEDIITSLSLVIVVHN